MGAAAPPSAVPANDALQKDAIAQRVQALLHDADATWSQQFQALGSQYPAPGITFFSQTVNKVCASDTALTGFFYCPGERKIYFDESASPADDLAVAYLIGHESG